MTESAELSALLDAMGLVCDCDDGMVEDCGHHRTCPARLRAQAGEVMQRVMAERDALKLKYEPKPRNFGPMRWAEKQPVDGKCGYCGSKIGSCAAGTFCTNQECGYIDGYYMENLDADQASRQPSQPDHLHEPNDWGVCRICAQREASRQPEVKK